MKKPKIKLIEDRYHKGYYFAVIEAGGTEFKTEVIRKPSEWEKNFEIISIKHAEIQIKDLDSLRVYFNDGDDQPTTCPMCDARTRFIQVDDQKQQHECNECGYEFFLDFE